jgi:hypothetical protein
MISCTMVLTGDNATRFAMRVISNTSKGRGASLPYELRDIDRRFNGTPPPFLYFSCHLHFYCVVILLYETVNFVYPMREVLAKSVAFFNHYSSISAISKPTFNSRKDVVKAPGINLLTESMILLLLLIGALSLL